MSAAPGVNVTPAACPTLARGSMVGEVRISASLGVPVTRPAPGACSEVS